MNEPYRVNLTDNDAWKSLAIKSVNGTVCSYKFQNFESNYNVYQIRINDFSNLRIGLYFYS